MFAIHRACIRDAGVRARLFTLRCGSVVRAWNVKVLRWKKICSSQRVILLAWTKPTRSLTTSNWTCSPPPPPRLSPAVTRTGRQESYRPVTQSAKTRSHLGAWLCSGGRTMMIIPCGNRRGPQ